MISSMYMTCSILIEIFTKYVYIMSTTVYVPSSELGLSQPLPQNRGGGEGHTRLRVRGWGSPNSDDLRKNLALCLLCGDLPSLLSYDLLDVPVKYSRDEFTPLL
jgi:hypothetical protein